MKTAFPCLVLLLVPVCAQEIKFPPELEKLASKAVETTNVTLDSDMLKAASKTLQGQGPGVQISGLKGIYVRSFKFAKEGEYSLADVEAIRTQLRGPGWKSIVSTRSKKGSADVAVKRDGDRVVGLVVLAAEPKELTFVNLDGPIELDKLGELGGTLGIPKISTSHSPKSETTKK
jgi:hypothetical protein